MGDNISNIGLSREFCLNSRIYNILSKIGDEYMRKKKRDKNRIL